MSSYDSVFKGFVAPTVLVTCSNLYHDDDTHEHEGRHDPDQLVLLLANTPMESNGQGWV